MIPHFAPMLNTKAHPALLFLEKILMSPIQGFEVCSYWIVKRDVEYITTGYTQIVHFGVFPRENRAVFLRRE